MASSSKLACLALAAFAAAAAVLAIITPCAAQEDSPQDFVDPHNAARSDVGAGAVSWDDTVAAYARSYGEDIFWGSGGGAGWSAADAVASWVAEKRWYDHGSNSCSAPEGRSCGHYTQVVWRDSTAVGCARVVCDNGGGVFITCNYNPPGNVGGLSPY